MSECAWCGEPCDEYAPCHDSDTGDIAQARDDDERAVDALDRREHILGSDWRDDT